MKKIIFLILLLPVIFTVNGCSSEGTVYPFFPNFTYEQTNEAPHAIKFTDTTIFTDHPAIKTYSWSFGEGEAGSFAINPSIYYSSAGIYRVQLTVCTEIFFCNSVVHMVTVR